MLKLVSIVIRVTDLPAQSTFWKEALDYVERDPGDDDWVVLKPRDADAPCIALDAHHSERVLPPRIHLDIYAEDQSAEVQRLTQLGAREVHWVGRPADADYVIMEDPEGLVGLGPRRRRGACLSKQSRRTRRGLVGALRRPGDCSPATVSSSCPVHSASRWGSSSSPGCHSLAAHSRTP